MLTSRPVIGETVGGYRIVSRLGAGSAGDVFLGEHASVGSRVAIKILNPADPQLVQRYLREVQAASRVGHAGTVKVSDIGAPAGGPAFVVMELLQGETLAARIARTGRLSVTQIAELGRQIATVLAAIHDDNLVHRDLRPEKVVIVRDSGLATSERIKLLPGTSGLLGATHPRAIPYLAPEGWRDPATADWRVDIYALGCMLFEMACGRQAFAGATADEVRDRHLGPTIPAARSHMPDVPPALDALIARLIAKHVEQRPKSMRELARELDGLGGSARPLAPTFQDAPVLVAGELHAPTLPPGPPIGERPGARPDARREARAAPPARSRLSFVVPVGVVLVVGGVLAIVLATR